MIFLFVILVLSLIFLFMIFPSVRKHPDREKMRGIYIAHRGLHSIFENCPENSIPAFREAINRNIAIETDIHLTLDGEIVVFHDDNLKRMCGIDAIIEEKTLEELRALKLKNTDEKIPTFSEFLRLVDGRVPILIEFKSKSLKNCKKLCLAADKMLKDYMGKYFIQSFFPFVLRWYKKNRKDIMRGQLSSGHFEEKNIFVKIASSLIYNFIGRPDFISYEFSYEKNIFRRFCAFLGAHSAGWTFKTQEEVNLYKDKFDTVIFEGFIPDEIK